MGRFVYNVTKAPIGWSLFRDRERVGGFVSKEAALEAATAAGADALREGSQHPNQRAWIGFKRIRKAGIVA